MAQHARRSLTSSSQDTPRLVIGIGATKAGTSWLYKYLRGHPQAHFKAIKEMHHFDMLDAGPGNWGRKRLDNRLRRMDAQVAKRAAGNSEHLSEMVADIREWLAVPHGDTAGYLSYLRSGAAGHRIMGEITPAYALLSEARLRDMVALTADVRLVYLLRDPVDRLWSNVKMVAGSVDSDRPLDERAYALLDRALDGNEEDLMRRSDYRSTLTRLRNSVPPEQLHVSYYETLFNPEGLRAVTGFLGIDATDAEFENKLDPTASVPLDLDRRKAAARLLTDQYGAVEEVMAQPLPERWQMNRKAGDGWLARTIGRFR